MDGVSYSGEMTPDSDDALNWEGDEAATPQDRALPHGWNAVGRGSEEVGTVEDDGTVTPAALDEPAGLSTPMLLILGVVGGVYLLYTIGWIVGGLRLKPLASFLVDDAMFLPWFVLAIAAPALWFLASWVLTRSKAAWIRVAVLLAGVVLLVPWPFVTVGVIGS
ncbi:MAG: hypothetical protein K0Q52_1447 [Microbacterium sp.]|nr:hypothetical protein [Microbacterium sp.]